MGIKKVSILGTVGVPASYGGFETLVENLIDDDSEISYSVYCSSKSYSQQKGYYKNAKLIYLPLNANGIQSIFYDIFSFIHTFFTRPDIVLVLGVSGCTFLPLYKFFSKTKIIVNIDGLEWRRQKWNKIAQKFLKFSEAIAVQYSDYLVTDNQAIHDYVKSEYNVLSKVIAYGGDHAVISPVSCDSENYSLSICRIEPENNCEMILEAFKLTKKPIKFVGNWNSSEYGRNLKAVYSNLPNITILDSIYDIKYLFNLRRKCALYIHGHSAGGTNPSLVEMMFFKIPILCFDCSYNRKTTDSKAHFFQDVTSLSAALSNSIHYDQALLRLAEKRYTWDRIRLEYLTLFSKLLTE